MDIDARVLILNDRNKILLVLEREKRIDVSGRESFTKPSKWGMPGGRSEPEDKDELATAEREVGHEIGILPKINANIRVEKQEPDHLKVAFIGYYTGGTIRIDLEEILEYRWLPGSILYNENFPIYVIQRGMAKELLRKEKKRWE